MATEGGFGLEVKITVSSTLTAIGHLQDESTWPEAVKVLSEETGHDADGGYAEHIATGKFNLGSFNVVVLWDPSDTTHAALDAAFDSLDAVAMSISNPSGTESWSFNAHVYSLGPSSRQTQGVRMAIKVQPTGKPTRASGSGS